MKIKEALNFINATMTVRAKVDDDIMYVYEKSLGDDDWFMRFSLYHLGWSAITADFDTCLDDDVDVMDLARVMDVVQRLICTPVNERFPEKKYRLRWIDDSDGAKSYVGLHLPTVNYQKDSWYMTTMLENKENNYKELWSESELEQLKKDNPRFAPAIDAMKEPAEDKDNEN